MKKSTIAIMVILAAGAFATQPAHAKIKFGKSFSSPSRSTSIFRPAPRKTVSVKSAPRPATRPVYVTAPVRQKSSGLSTGHVVGAAALAGVVGYMAGNHNSTPATPKPQVVAPTQPFVVSNPTNSIISCNTNDGYSCVNGWDKQTVPQFVAKAGFRTVIRQETQIHGSQKVIMIEVAR